MESAVSHSESLKMKAGTYVTIPVLLDSKSQVIKYTFTVAKGLDAELSCTLFDGEETIELISPRRITDVTDSMRVNLQLEVGGHRMIEFKLSNVFSWVRSKRFTYAISVQPETQATAPSLQNQAALPSVPAVVCSYTLAMRDADAEAERMRVTFEAASQEQVRLALKLNAAEVELKSMTRSVSELRDALLLASQRSSAAAVALSQAQAAADAAKAAAAVPSIASEAPGSSASATLSEQAPSSKSDSSKSEGHEAAAQQPLLVQQAGESQSPAATQAPATPERLRDQGST